MSTMKIAGRLLRASADDRVKTYLLAPFGEYGRTNLGKVKLTASSLTIPADVTSLVVNVEHEPTQPVAKFTRVEATGEGYEADVRFLATRAGDDALTETNEGVRTGISVEVDEPVIRNGQLLAGTLDGAAVCVSPAFPSARMVAADAGDLPDGADEGAADEITVDGVTYVRKTETTPKDSPEGEDAAEAADEEADMADEQTVETDGTEDQLKASLPGSIKGKAKAETPLFAQLAAADPAGREAIKVRLNAALDQAISTDLAPTLAKQWLGEVGAKTTYVPRVTDLVEAANLTTGGDGIGWRFVEGKTPQVDTYTGFPAQPNSNEVKTEQVTLSSTRLAGAGEVDRKWVDFPVPEFWTGFYRESSNDYKRKLDGIALAAMTGGATAVEAGTVADGVSTAAAYIVDGAMSVILAERSLPTFALVGADLYRDLLLTRAQDLIAFLTGALGLEEGDLAGFKIRPSGAASLTSKVLVGAKQAFTVYQLPGASPVRVDTVNIANGGVTTGVFGYHAELVNDAKSLALVAAPVAG